MKLGLIESMIAIQHFSEEEGMGQPKFKILTKGDRPEKDEGPSQMVVLIAAIGISYVPHPMLNFERRELSLSKDFSPKA